MKHFGRLSLIRIDCELKMKSGLGDSFWLCNHGDLGVVVDGRFFAVIRLKIMRKKLLS
jgi:hypothetical protein